MGYDHNAGRRRAAVLSASRNDYKVNPKGVDIIDSTENQASRVHKNAERIIAVAQNAALYQAKVFHRPLRDRQLTLNQSVVRTSVIPSKSEGRPRANESGPLTIPERLSHEGGCDASMPTPIEPVHPASTSSQQTPPTDPVRLRDCFVDVLAELYAAEAKFIHNSANIAHTHNANPRTEPKED